MRMSVDAPPKPRRKTRAEPMVVVSDGTIAPRTAERLLPGIATPSLRLDALVRTAHRHRSDHGWDGPQGDARVLSNVRDGRLATMMRTTVRNLRLASGRWSPDHMGDPAPWTIREALSLPWPITVIIDRNDAFEIVRDGTIRDGMRIGDADLRGSRITEHHPATLHHAHVVRDAALCLKAIADAALCLKAIADGTAVTTEQADAVMRTMASDMLGHAGCRDLRNASMRLARRGAPATLTGMDASGTTSIRDAPNNPFVRHSVVFRGVGMRDDVIRTHTPTSRIDTDAGPVELLRAAAIDAGVRDVARTTGAIPA